MSSGHGMSRPLRQMEDEAPAPPSPLPRWQRAAYGVGELIVAIRQVTFQFHLMPLYTDVMVIGPLLAGLGRMVGFVWDGLNDPLMGYVSDRTRSRLGRRRPFLIGAAIPLGLTFALVWSPPQGVAPWAGFLFLVVAFIVFDSFFTLYATPYLALGAEMSRDSHERTQIAAARGFFHIAGLFLGGALSGAFITTMPGPSGYARMGMVLGAIMVVAGLLAGSFTREAPPDQAPPPLSWRSFAGGFADTLRIPSFRVMLVTFAIVLLAAGLTQTMVPYAFRYWLQRPEVVNSVIVAYLASSVISIPIWSRLSRLLGKDRALRLCILWATTALMTIPLTLSPDMSNLRLGAFLLLAGLGNGGWVVLPVSIAADVIDEDELRTGLRREGAFFGVWLLVMKLSTAVASLVVGAGLQLVGYVPNVAQSAGATLGIMVLYGPVPSVLMLTAFLLFRRFPLTPARHREVQAALAARRG